MLSDKQLKELYEKVLKSIVNEAVLYDRKRPHTRHIRALAVDALRFGNIFADLDGMFRE